MSFITEDFLLRNETARELYHNHAAAQPIIDYHCHLPPQDVAANRRFANLFEIWLEGDHYKWRAMRTNGITEDLVTGDRSPKEKFMAFARTVPMALRNPLYHWCHLELKRYFGIDRLLNADTAEGIWDEANEKLAGDDLSAHGILKRFKVSVVCTTDDPTDSLDDHRRIAASGIGTRIYPTFRPDKAIGIENATTWNAWVNKLADVSGLPCDDFDGFLAALAARHDFFHSLGGRLSDHGLERCFAVPTTHEQASAIYEQVRSGIHADPDMKEHFASFLMLFFARLDHEKNWTKQLHLGAMRNNNDGLFRKLGPDIGCDSIGDYLQGVPLSRYLGALSGAGILPKTILYNLNPADNYLFATMAGNFQEGGVAGKIQYGSGWWFLDQLEGMTWQINALSNLGLLGRFVGMLTDSRSFMSYPRHEYFRRLLCNMIGTDVENGELPRDMDLLGGLVRDIAYGNASRYFGFGLGDYN